MATTTIDDVLRIPPIRSLANFRRWALSEEFPDAGRIDYIAGQIEVDMSPEDLYTHGTLKAELVRVLASRLREDEWGDVFTESTRVSLPVAELSVEPDVVVLSNEAIDSGRVRLVPKSAAGADRYIEIEGPPDLVVEIVSDSSVSKDTRRLPPAYFAAGVREFWLVDARGDSMSFVIHHPGARSYQPSQVDGDGFQESLVLARRYRLDRRRNRSGRPAYDLSERSPETTDG